MALSKRAARAAGPANARPSRIRLTERWSAWRRHHSQSAAESLARVLQAPVSSSMTWLVIGIAIALPSGLWVVLDNVTTLSERLDTPTQLSLFLDEEFAREEALALALELRQREDVREVVFLDRDDALAEFARRSGMLEITDSLVQNPLPHLLLVSPQAATPAQLEVLQLELASLASVQEVLLDTLWLQRLQSLMSLGRRAVQLLAVLLLSAVVLILGNTIRLAIESRREEIIIVKLVGGSDPFVRRPLLYTGLWFGLGGGVFAALLVAMGAALLAPPVKTLASSYQSDFALTGLGLVDSLQLVLLGAVLGLIGAWLAVARHLRAIEPR
ncbi:MAG: permease-like cell division protein FtsX [Congregibacter sp.]